MTYMHNTRRFEAELRYGTGVISGFPFSTI